jgi:hypothetical protein
MRESPFFRPRPWGKLLPHRVALAQRPLGEPRRGLYPFERRSRPKAGPPLASNSYIPLRLSVDMRHTLDYKQTETIRLTSP